MEESITFLSWSCSSKCGLRRRSLVNLTNLNLRAAVWQANWSRDRISVTQLIWHGNSFLPAVQSLYVLRLPYPMSPLLIKFDLGSHNSYQNIHILSASARLPRLSFLRSRSPRRTNLTHGSRHSSHEVFPIHHDWHGPPHGRARGCSAVCCGGGCWTCMVVECMGRGARVAGCIGERCTSSTVVEKSRGRRKGSTTATERRRCSSRTGCWRSTSDPSTETSYIYKRWRPSVGTRPTIGRLSYCKINTQTGRPNSNVEYCQRCIWI